MTPESPDTIHGRMKEGAHIAGYSLTRSIENLRWLLEDAKYEQLSAGYRNVNDFLRDTADAFKLLDIKPEERKQIAELIKTLQPQASQRAIADLVGVSNETIAKDLGARTSVNKLTAQDKTSEENIPTSVNKLTPPALPPDDYDAVKEKRRHQALYGSSSDDWNTPPEIVRRVIEVMGNIDLDPCSNNKTNPNIPAKNHLIKEDDGLSIEWGGKVYMNPPYGREISDWVSKLLSDFESGCVDEAIALVPSRTDTEWFRKLRIYPRCFVWGRIKFGDIKSPAPFPSMAIYLGKNKHKFIECFEDIGDVYELSRHE